MKPVAFKVPAACGETVQAYMDDAGVCISRRIKHTAKLNGLSWALHTMLVAAYVEGELVELSVGLHGTGMTQESELGESVSSWLRYKRVGNEYHAFELIDGPSVNEPTGPAQPLTQRTYESVLSEKLPLIPAPYSLTCDEEAVYVDGFFYGTTVLGTDYKGYKIAFSILYPQ